MKKLLTLSLLGAALTAVPAMGAILTFDSAASFLGSAVVNAVPGALATEAFNGGTASLFTFTNGPACTGCTSSIVDPAPVDGNYVRQTRVNNTTPYQETITPIAGAVVTGGTLTGPLTAWGATFDINVGGIGTGLDLIINHVGGSTTTFTNINLREASPDGIFFFGMTIDGATPLISSITIRSATGQSPDATGEFYYLDDIMIEGPVTGGGGGGAVPEPSTFGLMGLALVGLGMTRRFRA